MKRQISVDCTHPENLILLCGRLMQTVQMNKQGYSRHKLPGFSFVIGCLKASHYKKPGTVLLMFVGTPGNL